MRQDTDLTIARSTRSYSEETIGSTLSRMNTDFVGGDRENASRRLAASRNWQQPIRSKTESCARSTRAILVGKP